MIDVIRVLASAGVALMAVFALAGCEEHNKTYSLTPEAAKAALVGTKIPGAAFAHSAHSRPATPALNRVTWDVRAGTDGSAGFDQSVANQVVIKLRATLTASADGTQVVIDLLPPDGIAPAVIETLNKQEPAIANLFRSIAREQVDSTLMKRAYSMTGIRAETAVATISQLSKVRQYMREDAEKNQRKDRELMDRAYQNDRRG